MNTLHKLGWVAGVVGFLLCAVGVVLRLSGAFWIGGFQLGTLLLAGVTAMVFGCWCFLAVLVQRR
jgi:hypothetical protein